MSPQLSCGDTWQMLTWLKVFILYFCKIEISRNGEINKRSFSNPHPDQYYIYHVVDPYIVLSLPAMVFGLWMIIECFPSAEEEFLCLCHPSVDEWEKKKKFLQHYSVVIMAAMASVITSLTSVYSTVHPAADQRKYQSSASLVFVRGIHWIPRTNGQ